MFKEYFCTESEKKIRPMIEWTVCVWDSRLTEIECLKKLKNSTVIFYTPMLQIPMNFNKWLCNDSIQFEY